MRRGLSLLILMILISACDSTTQRRRAPATVSSRPDLAIIDSEVSQRPDLSTGMDAQVVMRDAAMIDAGLGNDAGFVRDAELRPDAMNSDDGFPKFAFSIHADDRALLNTRTVFGVDHDPAVYSGVNRYICRNYADQGFPWCYDEHRGTDYTLSNGFTAMDAGSARVLAAAGGTVIAVEDGNYDRCHADLSSGNISCDGYPMRANFVALQHPQGWTTRYLHLKRDSIIVQVGDRVRCGEMLGLVGSSGYSSGPHLHFEVQDVQNRVWDPYRGTLSQPETLWNVQDFGDGLPGQMCHLNWTAP
jgi:hypothetical protein